MVRNRWSNSRQAGAAECTDASAEGTRVAWDPGNFLFDAGQLMFYDFEAADIGDPLADLAVFGLKIRQGTEPLAGSGLSIRRLRIEGRASVDLPALSFHSAASC